MNNSSDKSEQYCEISRAALVQFLPHFAREKKEKKEKKKKRRKEKKIIYIYI